MQKKLIIIITIIILLLPVGFISQQNQDSEKTIEQHSFYKETDDKNTGLSKNGRLCSHLPIIIIESNGQVIPGQSRDDKRKLLCNFKIIDNKEQNKSNGKPSQKGYALVSIRGNSSRNLIKKQYSFKMVDEEGNDTPRALLDMPSDTTWTLNGSLIDHGLIRNYVCYNIAGNILKGTPRARICELMLTDKKGKPEYQGFYTLIEKPKVSENRVDLTPYNPKYKETSFMLQMSTKLEENIINHISIDDAWPNPYELIYPSPEKITDESFNYIQSEMYRIEKIIRDANYTGNWTKVREALDYDSFADYYVINEFFQNYDAGRLSTYVHRNLGGKLEMGPVWDFDGCFDNFSTGNIKYDELRLRKQFYYYQITNDPEFSRLCVKKYKEYRKTYLSEECILKYIDDGAEFVGSAADRNADLWYSSDYKLFHNEINNMKKYVIKRGRWLDKHFEEYSTVVEWKGAI